MIMNSSMKKRIVISLFLCIVVALFILIKKHNQKRERERIELVIRNSDNYKNAKANFYSGDLENAFTTYLDLLENNPEQDWLRLELGDMYKSNKDHKNALKYYFSIRRPKELSIGYGQVYLRIGGIHEELGNNDSAVFYYNKIINSKTRVDELIGYDNDKESAFSRLGKISVKNKEYTKAIDNLSQAIDIKRVPRAIYIRANAYYLNHQPELAQKDYEESIDLIRKIHIHNHPVYKHILCDTCGPNFGTEAYLAVLEEWRNLDEQIEEMTRVMDIAKSHRDYKIVFDSFPKWERQVDSLKDFEDFNSIQRYRALKDSMRKYTDTIMVQNIYE